MHYESFHSSLIMVSPMSCNSNFVQYFLNRQRRSLKVESGGPRGKVDHSKIKYWELHNLHKNAIKYAAPEAHSKSNLKLIKGINPICVD